MSVRKTSGRKPWVCDLRGIGCGQRRYRTKEEAQAKHNEKMRLFGTAEQAKVDFNITVREYAACWQATMPEHWKENTRSAYEAGLRLHILPHFGEQKVRELAAAGVLGWAQQKARAGLKRATIQLQLSILRLVCRRAIVDGLLVANPVDRGVLAELGFQKKAAADTEEKVTPFTAEELVRFLTAAAERDPDFAVMCETQVKTGLRPGEVYGLHVSDVVDEAGAIRELLLVRRTTSRNGRTTGSPKTATSRREVEISPALTKRLTRYVDAKGLRFLPDSPLFPQREGAPYRSSGTTKYPFKRTLRLAELPLHHKPHDLRHTYATLHLENGADMLWVSRQMGHASIKMTVDLYGKWARPRRPEAGKALDALLAAAEPARATRGAA